MEVFNIAGALREPMEDKESVDKERHWETQQALAGGRCGGELHAARPRFPCANRGHQWNGQHGQRVGR